MIQENLFFKKENVVYCVKFTSLKRKINRFFEIKKKETKSNIIKRPSYLFIYFFLPVEKNKKCFSYKRSLGCVYIS